MTVATAVPARRWALPVPVVTSAAVVGGLVGLVLLAVALSQPRVHSAGQGEPVVVGGLAVAVEEAAWVAHDPSGMGGMPMGAPGDAPAPGSRRLHIQVSLANAGNPTEVVVDSFRLRAASGRSWTPQRTTMADVTAVADGGALVGDLYFEVPDGEKSLSLTMDRGRSRAVLAVPVSGGAPMPAHDEGEAK